MWFAFSPEDTNPILLWEQDDKKDISLSEEETYDCYIITLILEPYGSYSMPHNPYSWFLTEPRKQQEGRTTGMGKKGVGALRDGRKRALFPPSPPPEKFCRLTSAQWRETNAQKPLLDKITSQNVTWFHLLWLTNHNELRYLRLIASAVHRTSKKTPVWTVIKTGIQQEHKLLSWAKSLHDSLFLFLFCNAPLPAGRFLPPDMKCQADYVLMQ